MAPALRPRPRSVRARAAASPATGAREQRLKEMVSYVRAHFRERITVEDLARHACVSRTECFRCFQSVMGKSPMAYIAEYRLSMAAMLLANTRQSVAEIALSCGFCSPATSASCSGRNAASRPDDTGERAKDIFIRPPRPVRGNFFRVSCIWGLTELYRLYILYMNRSYGGMPWNCSSTTRAERPIYEQICEQVRAQIVSGALKEDEPLPSIRALAKDLRISVITTKRAYDELLQAGYVYAVAGKGYFVAPRNVELLREENLRPHRGAPD